MGHFDDIDTGEGLDDPAHQSHQLMGHPRLRSCGNHEIVPKPHLDIGIGSIHYLDRCLARRVLLHQQLLETESCASLDNIEVAGIDPLATHVLYPMPAGVDPRPIEIGVLDRLKSNQTDAMAIIS